MTTADYKLNNSGRVTFVIMVPMILSVVIYMICWILGDTFLTKHAESAHANETWKAESIKEYMQSGKCKPQRFDCEHDSTMIYTCKLKPSLSIGLVISTVTNEIITGFSARPSYWNNRPGCLPLQ